MSSTNIEKYFKNIRVDESNHRKLRIIAAQNGDSMNTTISKILSKISKRSA